MTATVNAAAIARAVDLVPTAMPVASPAAANGANWDAGPVVGEGCRAGAGFFASEWCDRPRSGLGRKRGRRACPAPLPRHPVRYSHG